MTQTITIDGLGTRRLHFNSRLARILGGPRGVNNAVSPNARDIYISRDYIWGYHLAHEWQHGIDAAGKGWKYLPWVIWGYVSTFSHDKAPAEIRADAFMAANTNKFPRYVRAQ